MKRATVQVLTLLLVLAMTAGVLSGCGSSTNDSGSAGNGGNEGNTQTDGTGDAGDGEVVTLDVGLLGTGIKPVGVLVARALGYFEEEGVNINFQQVSSMNDAYTAVSTGDLDVYLFSSTAAATFISQGVTTLRVFGGTAAEGSEIMAAKGSGIVLDSPDDFVGLTIGCFMAETGQMVLKNYLMEEGYTIGAPGEGADVSFVYYSDTSSGIAACVNGEYDLVLTNSCLGYYADDYGVDVVATVSDFVSPYPCCRQTCNSDTYANEFDALVRFEIAAMRGHAYALENEEETLDILEEYSGEDRDFLRAQVYGTDSYTPDMRLSLDPDKDACVAFYEAMANIGEIQPVTEINWGDYVVTDVYSTALAELSQREPDNALWAEMTDYFEAHNT